MIKHITAGLTGVLLVAGVGYALYNILLTDEAKRALKSSYTSVKEAYTLISDCIVDRRGVVVTEDELPNQVATRVQWEALGY